MALHLPAIALPVIVRQCHTLVIDVRCSTCTSFTKTPAVTDWTCCLPLWRWSHLRTSASDSSGCWHAQSQKTATEVRTEEDYQKREITNAEETTRASDDETRFGSLRCIEAKLAQYIVYETDIWHQFHLCIANHCFFSCVFLIFAFYIYWKTGTHLLETWMALFNDWCTVSIWKVL